MATEDTKSQNTNEKSQKPNSNPVIENKAGAAGKSKMKILWIAIGGLILLIAGSLIFAVPYFKESRAAGEQGKETSEEKDKSTEPEQEPVKATLALDPFLVNLADQGFVKSSFQLGLAEEPEEDTKVMTVAAMRDSIITLLTSKTAEQMLTPQGKVKLREQIKARLNELSPNIKVVEVYIVDFVVQL